MYEIKAADNQIFYAETLDEAQAIKGREYNLYLADMLEKNNRINPKRGNYPMYAFIIEGDKIIEWKINNKGEDK